MSRYLDRHSMGPDGRSKSGMLMGDDAEAGVTARQASIRARKPGRCTQARKRLKHVFHMRKYYRSVMGLTGVEAVLVIIRLILETESLRFPPGNTRTTLLSTQLGLFCLSLFTLLLFVIEQPFKWWALGSRRFCTSVMFVLDAITCLVCFALNIHNIHANVTRPNPEAATPQQLVFCKMNQLTTPAETCTTFAILGGLSIVIRLWCISGYIQTHTTHSKWNMFTLAIYPFDFAFVYLPGIVSLFTSTEMVQNATVNLTQKLGSIQKANEEAQVRITQLETMLREQETLNRSNQSRGSTRTGQSNTQTRSSSQTQTRSSSNRRSQQDPRTSRSTALT
ncbi:unnamed protein product [Echinostoma caproni]|uniref:Ion_trans domain-containing protein n=1 Tax=Echinostoma caproni TaxID=27848 RepID=A0A183AKW7_9TREM|nr:unnamed protein product [Echinostoma caproni]